MAIAAADENPFLARRAQRTLKRLRSEGLRRADIAPGLLDALDLPAHEAPARRALVDMGEDAVPAIQARIQATKDAKRIAYLKALLADVQR